MKIISLFICFAMLFSLTACGLPSEADESEDTSPADVTEPVVSIDEAIDETIDVVPDSVPEIDGVKLETPIYDNTAVIGAHRSGDISALDEKQLAIYNAALEAISEFYSEGMSDEDTVIAAHDWITTNLMYDEKMLLPIPQQSEDSENPYGALMNHQGICMGYTTTFQLFMDMLGIECVIVHGAAQDEEHAWNMVNIDGNWYHVDTTWDDFVPDEPDRQPFHIYCLVPDYVMEVQHVWDRENSPAATAEDKIYYQSHGLYAQSSEQTRGILDSAYSSGTDYAEVMTPSKNEQSFNHVSAYWTIDCGEYIITIYWL